MATAMEQIRAYYAFQFEYTDVQNLLFLNQQVMEEIRQRLEDHQAILEDYRRNTPLMDVLMGKKKQRLAQLEQELQEVQGEYDSCARDLARIRKHREGVLSREPLTADAAKALTEEVQRDPKNTKELSYLNARMCVMSVDTELTRILVNLEDCCEILEELEETGNQSLFSELKECYEFAVGRAKALNPYLLTFQAEMEELRFPWRMPDFFRDPAATQPTVLREVEKAARETEAVMDSMKRAILTLQKQFPGEYPAL